MTNISATDADFDLSLARPDTLGSVVRDGGTSFALFSDNAQQVDLCLYDAEGKTEIARRPLPEMEGGIWYGFLPGVGPGQVYGYRVHGDYAPDQGHRFNPAKLLLDPYARALKGDITWNDALFGYPVGQDDLTRDDRDSAPFMPKGVVVDTRYDWHHQDRLSHRWKDTVICEAHVKGLTMRHPGVVQADRGTFAGLAADPVIEHLHRIGVTAIELLPVHAFANDRHLIEKGLSNYWGYNTLSFFAPHAAYLKSGDLAEVKQAIDRFHAAGIEVILDVVYNHTCEGNEMGPTLSFRGIDNASYYLLSDDPRHCYDTTGCGNTVNVAHPMVLRMILDSLRYWVTDMHVDGFRFDLASTLGRESSGFEREGGFFAAIRQDPILAGVKLIAEPWDIGDGGYQVGGFPWPFREWNDKARDDLRGFWRRDPGLLPHVAERLSGSPVQFDHSHRPATSSINFLAAHDGFTLWDTLSYDDKHNDANGEDGRDGHDHNISHNLGCEGPTDDAAIIEARLRRAKGMLATLFMAQGVPMLLAGDAFGQSQQGNNNAYCQDNDIAWLDWESARSDLTNAVATMTALRRDLPSLISPRFVRADAEGHAHGASWLHPAGREMTEGDWDDAELRCMAKLIEMDDGAQVLILLNAGDDAEFTLPEGNWHLRLDTARDAIACDEPVTERVGCGWQSVQVLNRRVLD
ncbi:glycogen debranching protein GlgX [Pseudoruegeria sp. SK021]|uniref:glycogen debranching protein GlgX n=1 Tax=Pseudoruegeria sp. SK021 TaxID=1933035 RepID=UPI000A227E24|nr:glycogen debranching protein GlgX [Pseudoruegeria sp. SK021]OSP53900.1 glycogen debranching enzyme GlgX [Pseudoruegeria sp. SK021]